MFARQIRFVFGTTLALGFLGAQPALAGGGIVGGSFEDQAPGAPVSIPWLNDGGGHLISPSGAESDGAMPIDGVHWAEITAGASTNATPPSNPGGVTLLPVGGRGISYQFCYEEGVTELVFSALFLDAEGNNNINDWMSVDVHDGVTAHNLFYMDTQTARTLPQTVSSKQGAQDYLRLAPLQKVKANLAELFPASTTATGFTLMVQVGNDHDDQFDSKGYIDDVKLRRFFEDVPLVLGSRASGPMEVDTTRGFTFEAIEGTVVSLTATRRKGLVEPAFSLTAPDETELLAPADSVLSPKKAGVKKLELTQTGVYRVELINLGGDGEHNFKTKGKIPKSFKLIAAVDPLDGEDPILLPAIGGSTLKSLKVSAIKPKGDFAAIGGVDADLSPAIAAATAPDASPLDLGEIKVNKKGTKLAVKNVALPVLGIYEIILSGVDNSVGFAKVSAKITPPKKAKGTVLVP